jgi:hypothetical protein
VTKVTDNIWIGNSDDAKHADLNTEGISAILNCAHDLQGVRGWGDNVLYGQCGLQDGPGNRLSTYHAAVLMLYSMIADGRKVLVHCHMGQSRSVAVAIMYLHMTQGRGWDYWRKVIRERRETPEHTPHEAHKAAFNRINWRLLSSVL